MRSIREPKAKPREELRLSTVTTSCLLIEQIPPTSIGVYTDTFSKLEEAHRRNHSTATYTYGGGSAYERITLTATNICMITQFMNSMFETYTERDNAFELLSLAALPVSLFLF
jgi:hypothetical protein